MSKSQKSILSFFQPSKSKEETNTTATQNGVTASDFEPQKSTAASVSDTQTIVKISTKNKRRRIRINEDSSDEEIEKNCSPLKKPKCGSKPSESENTLINSSDTGEDILPETDNNTSCDNYNENQNSVPSLDTHSRTSSPENSLSPSRSSAFAVVIDTSKIHTTSMSLNNENKVIPSAPTFGVCMTPTILPSKQYSKNAKLKLKANKKKAVGTSGSKTHSNKEPHVSRGSSRDSPVSQIQHDVDSAEVSPSPEKTAKFTMSSTTASSDESLSFDPESSSFHPINSAFWKPEEAVPYLALARTLEKIEAISARLKIIEILRNYFRSVIALSPDDLVHSIYLCLNQLAPAYKGIELGVGESFLIKAISQCTGRPIQKIKEDVIEKGDIGIVAEASRGNQKLVFKPANLTVKVVFSKLKEIALMSGTASQQKKVEKVKGLFVACRYSEARYLMRSLSGKLRIGLAEQSVLTALSHAIVYTPPSNEHPAKIVDISKTLKDSTEVKRRCDEAAIIIKTAYCECPSYDIMIPALLKYGLKDLPKYCRLSPGIPLKPMLAHPTKGIEEVFKRLDKGDFICEFKYDGERAQLHGIPNKNNQNGVPTVVQIYSRNSENNTSKYPDVIARMADVTMDTTTSYIFDSEVVAWDPEKKHILPFQVLSTRKRKDADKEQIKVQVCLYVFDLLYLNGESLVRLSLRERREKLHSAFREIEGIFMFATSRISSDADVISEFLDESVKNSCEGLMVKSLDIDATYEIAKRSHNWLKLKKDYLEGVGDTLDLVVLGGYHGTGKRTGKYGGFLLAVYDDENEEFQSICKIGTGFSDANLDDFAKFFSKHIIAKPKPYYRLASSVSTAFVEPDHWFDTVQVWEVKAADLSISPTHTAAAGLVDPEKGISLRFPRFIRIRDDKKAEDATSSSQVATMYRNQQQILNQKQNNNNNNNENITEEEFY